MFAQTDRDGRGNPAVLRVEPVQLQQSFDLLARLRIFVPQHQDLGVIEARGVIVRGQGQHAVQQDLGIVENIAGHSDPGQQPHSIGMVAVLDKECPDDGFRAIEIAIGEQRCRSDDLRRQVLERGDVIGRGGGIRHVARDAVDPFEHPPTEGQRRIEGDGRQQRLNRAARILLRHITQAALLVQKAEARIMLFQALERRQRVFDPAKMSETDRYDQKEIAIVRRIPQQRPRIAQGLGVQILLLETPQPQNFLLERRCACCRTIHRDPGNDFGGHYRPPKHSTIARTA